jgi:glycosyltransferase involved in cell wall biosynthesis
MRVVFIGNDTSIITGTNGDSRLRQLEYAKHFDILAIIIFSLKKDGLREELIGKLRLIPTNSDTRWHYIPDSLKILKTLKNYEVISAQDPFIAGFTGVLGKLFFGFKLNIQLHVDLFSSGSFKKESFQNFIFYYLAQLTLIFADSIRSGSKRLLINNKAFLAQVPMDVKLFAGKFKKRLCYQIVTVARLVKQKNLPMLLAAFSQINKKYPGLKLIIVGDGPQRAGLAADARNLGLGDSVKFLGYRTKLQCAKIYRQSDLFLSCSNYEGWGMAVTEAVAAGLPVAVTDTGCAGEFVVHKKISGLVSPIGDRQAFVNNALTLLRNRKFAGELVVRGQDYIRTRLQKDELVSKFVRGLEATI